MKLPYKKFLVGSLSGLSFILSFFLGFLMISAAESIGQESVSQVLPAAQNAPDTQPSSRPKNRKGKLPREKEAEGTQAPNRFDADTILKSRYELNGQPLEVDPD